MGKDMIATTIRLDSDLRSQATDLLEGMGLTVNGYFQIALKQLVNQQKIPFEIVAASPVPNEATRRAIVEAQAKELGLMRDDSPSFLDVEEAVAYLENA